MSDSNNYKPGDVVNGHVLGDDNVWHPVAEQSEPLAAQGVPVAAPGVVASPMQPAAPGYVAQHPDALVQPLGTPNEPARKPHVLSIIALVAAAIGFIFACIPGALVVGWVLLPIAFVLSIVALFLKGRKWPAITALIVAVVGTIVGVIVFFAVVATSFNSALGSTDGTVSTPAPSKSSSDSPKADTATNPKFGDVFTYNDGVTITVSAPTPFTPGQYSAGADQANNVTLTFIITNGSKKNLDVATLPTVTSAGVAASAIIDTDNSALSIVPPSSTVLPDQSLTWTSGFSIADPNNLQVEIAPAVFAYKKAIFTNIAG